MDFSENGEIILVTGGSGFIGQHIIKYLLQEKDNLGINEIRSVDIIAFNNKIGLPKSSVEVRSFVADICEAQEIDDAFKDVTTVFHCAALVSLEYPPNFDELQRINVDGTRNVVEKCVQHNVQRLIYTSCASVCMVPFRGSTFSLVINQTESKAITPMFDAQKPDEFEKAFIIKGYSSTKLRAENIVLNANGTALKNQKGYLATAAIRPPLTYGEGDPHFVPKVFDYLSKHSNMFPRIAGAGGKQQLAYAGNVAWGHVNALTTLKKNPKAIGGLPVFVTDDTPINDISRFVQKMALLGKKFKINLTWWYIPHILFFLISYLIEFCAALFYPITKSRIGYSLRAIASFTASVLMFNRMRASIYMDYVPIVDSEYGMQQSATWYAEHWQNMRENKKRH